MCLLGVPFGCHFGLIFGSFSSLKIRAIFAPLRGPILGSFWGSFWCLFQTRKEDLYFTCFSCPFESLVNPGMAIKHIKNHGFCMVFKCSTRSDKTPESVQNGSKKRPKYDPKLVSKLASENGSKMAPKWLQKWSQNGSENDLENDLKKDTQKELFHKPELARNGKRVKE